MFGVRLLIANLCNWTAVCLLDEQRISTPIYGHDLDFSPSDGPSPLHWRPFHRSRGNCCAARLPGAGRCPVAGPEGSGWLLSFHAPEIEGRVGQTRRTRPPSNPHLAG